MEAGQTRLRPRLGPRPLWGVSAYRLLTRSQWQRIRGDALTAAANTCSVCGAVREQGMVCDEEWIYAHGRALMHAFRAICPDCNGVTHFGRTNAAGYGQVALEHMARVNAITVGDALAIVDADFEEWRRRSQADWTVVVSADLLARYPELAGLVGLAGAAEN